MDDTITISPFGGTNIFFVDCRVIDKVLSKGGALKLFRGRSVTSLLPLEINVTPLHKDIRLIIKQLLAYQ